MSFKQHPFYYMNIFIEADHFTTYGLSMTIGYALAKKINSSEQNNLHRLSLSTINDHWEHEIIHLSIEYDLATEQHPNMPRCGINYNRLVNGKNVIQTSTWGGNWGFQFAYRF